MKSIVFDAGPIISLATNNLLWMLKPLKEKFRGNFYITPAVKREIVDAPLATKRFKFEAIQVQKQIDDEVLELIDNEVIRNKTPALLGTANQIFSAYGNGIRIVHFAEMSVIAACVSIKGDAVVIDEKTTRFLIENPRMVVEILRKTLRTPIRIDENNLKHFSNFANGIRLIRSVELVVIAYELGLLDGYIADIPDARRNLLESALWGVKLNGCAVSREEIEQIMRIESPWKK